MVIDDFDVMRIVVVPAEADAPLLVNSNAVLAFSVAAESFEVIARRYSESFDLSDSGNDSKLIQCSLLNVAWELPRKMASKYFGRFFASEALNHA